MWPPHPNTTTNKKIICSKSYYSVSEVSSNMSAISRYFYEGLGVNSGSEIVFLVKKSPKRLSTAPTPPLVSDRPDISDIEGILKIHDFCSFLAVFENFALFQKH